MFLQEMTSEFYAVDRETEESVSVYLFFQDVVPEMTGIYVVRGVVPWKGMEEDIRSRYTRWCEESEPLWKKGNI